MNEGLFLVFSGLEGTGKSTQAKMLADALTKKGHEIVLTKEPGGEDPVCAGIRSLLLDPEHKGKFSPKAELLLFEANRAQHVDFVVAPALQQGKIVISDRFDVDTYAYQCEGRGVCGYEEFYAINRFALEEFRKIPRILPDFTFWMDIDPKIGLRRNVDAKKHDRFEMEDLKFHEKLRDGFEHYFKRHCLKSKWKRLNAERSIRELHIEALSITQQLIQKRKFENLSQ